MSNTIQLGSSVAPKYSDPRRLATTSHFDRYRGGEDYETRIVTDDVLFTANAGGTTTTLVGANSDATTGANVVRLGEKFKLFDSSGNLKEETVFTVDSIAVGASDTVTFSPAAEAATVSGDEARLVGFANQNSMDSLDDRLLAAGFSQTYIDKLTLNDKQYQVRVLDDPGSL